MKAIAQITDLEDAVKKISVEVVGSIAHSNDGKQRQISRKKPLLTLDRTELTEVFLNTLEQKYNKQRLKIYFDYSCLGVDLTTKQANFSSSSYGSNTVNYDLIIGADGARSVVRKSFLDLKLFELEQKYIDNDYKSLYLAPKNSINRTLESNKIHSWRLDDGTVILLLHQHDGSMAGVIHFPRDSDRIASLKSEAEVKQFFEQNFPQVAQLMSEVDVSAFFNRPVATTLTIRCNRYHYQNSALLIGDAAHAVSPSLGQGCNSALEDVTILDRLLDEYGDDLNLVLEQFTKRRLADAHAIVELSKHALPFSRSLFIELILRQRMAKFLHRFFPQRFFPPLFDALNDSSISYADIFQQYQGWCNKVEKSKQKTLEALSV